MHCGRFLSLPTRRDMLRRCASGFGAVALEALLADAGFAAPLTTTGARGVGDGATGPSLTLRAPTGRATPHFKPRARNVIFLFMDGGPSQVDTFDPKPRLQKEHGRPISMKVPATQFNNVGTVLQSPWRFRPYGKSGTPVSDLFPKVARWVDDLAVVRSMVSNSSVHTNANYFLHSGQLQQGRPSMGAWVTYGLGSECQNLPGFVVLECGLVPPGGLDCFHNGFLPASYQGTILRAGDQPLADLRPADATPEAQKGKLSLMRKLDRAGMARPGAGDPLESAVANYELAFRMQAAVPDLLDLRGESRATRALYGLDDPYVPTQLYAQQCLLARRLVERGVRFVELLCPHVGTDRWDQHSDLKNGHARNARAVDQPIAGLLRDLKARGLLDHTLVVWAGEFGRTPMAQGSDGRDHNPFGFSIWLAGGGVKGGTVYGQTDEYGYFVVENKVEIHDLHATMLHLLGLDHKRVTYRFGGRDMRLTDMHGEVVRGILA